MPFSINWSSSRVLKQHVQPDRHAPFLVLTVRAADAWSFRERSPSKRAVSAANDSSVKGTEVFRTCLLCRRFMKSGFQDELVKSFLCELRQCGQVEALDDLSGSWWGQQLRAQTSRKQARVFLTWTKEIPESIHSLRPVSGSLLHSARLVLGMWLPHTI